MYIEESELFAGIVMGDNPSEEEKEDIRKNLQLFKNVFVHNIFKDVYYALYKAIIKASRYVFLNSRQLEHILLNSVDELIEDPNINKKNFEDEDDPSEQRTKENFISSCLYTFEQLKNTHVSPEDFKLNVELYCEQFKLDRFKSITIEAYKIANEGIKKRSRFIKGADNAFKYISNEYGKICTMIAGFDDGAVPIRSGIDGFEESENNKDVAEKRDVCDFGIEEIDSVVGMLKTSYVVTIMGASGSGKTRNSINLAYRALRNGKNLVWGALESTPKEVEAMLVARHIAEEYNNIPISDKEIIDNSIGEEFIPIVKQAKADLFMNESYGRFSIVPGPLFIEDLENILSSEYDNWQPFDMFVLDYPSLLRSREGKSRYEIVTEFYTLSKNLAMTFKRKGILVVSPHQLRAETIKDIIAGKDPDTTAGADSSESIKSSDLSVAVFADVEMNFKQILDYFCIKSRHSPAFPKFTAYAQHGNCYYASTVSST